MMAQIIQASNNEQQLHDATNQCMMGNPHGRNFSVNLPYASKSTLHTNMSTL